MAKKAAKLLTPGQYCVVLGVGGLGHVALQSLHELCGARQNAVYRTHSARAFRDQLHSAMEAQSESTVDMPMDAVE